MDNITKKELIAQDDGSLIDLGHCVNGQYLKTINTYPYIPTNIAKSEFDLLKNSLRKIPKEHHQTNMIEYYHV